MKLALAFYACKDTWINYGIAALEDTGDVAREALTQLKGTSDET